MTSSIYNWKTYLQPFGRGGAVKLWEEKDQLLNEWINQLITKLFEEQPLALPGSDNYNMSIWYKKKSTVTGDTWCGVNILSKFQL